MFFQKFSDGTPDFTSPHRKGFRFADTNDADRIHAEAAYRERSKRMEDAWRDKRVLAPEKRDTARTPSLDQLQAQAEQAWEERNERMRNSWRTSKEA